MNGSYDYHQRPLHFSSHPNQQNHPCQERFHYYKSITHLNPTSLRTDLYLSFFSKVTGLQDADSVPVAEEQRSVSPGFSLPPPLLPVAP